MQIDDPLNVPATASHTNQLRIADSVGLVDSAAADTRVAQSFLSPEPADFHPGLLLLLLLVGHGGDAMDRSCRASGQGPGRTGGPLGSTPPQQRLP